MAYLVRVTVGAWARVRVRVRVRVRARLVRIRVRVGRVRVRARVRARVRVRVRLRGEAAHGERAVLVGAVHAQDEERAAGVLGVDLEAQVCGTGGGRTRRLEL